MVGLCLSDAQWAKVEPYCLGKKSDPGRTGSDGWLFFEAVLWIARTGGPWRDLPTIFGNWNTLFKRIRLTSSTGSSTPFRTILTWTM